MHPLTEGFWVGCWDFEQCSVTSDLMHKTFGEGHVAIVGRHALISHPLMNPVP